jgi:DNA mismatch endonuclease (patch repair protein)
MRAVKARDTGPERRLRAALDGLGLAYGLHAAGLPGTPDVCFPDARLAVFVDGDFWHGHAWRETGRLPGTNAAFWRHKIEANIARDVRVDAALQALGWRTVRLRERDVMKRPQACARFVRRLAVRAA